MNDKSRGRNNTLSGQRIFTLNTFVRVNQIEATRDNNIGDDESEHHSLETVTAFREAVAAGWPEAKITWPMSWLALHSNGAFLQTGTVSYGFR